MHREDGEPATFPGIRRQRQRINRTAGAAARAGDARRHGYAGVAIFVFDSHNAHDIYVILRSHSHTHVSHPKGRPTVARATDESTDQSDKPKIHVTRNGEIYVTAKDVVKSKKFQEQIKKMANIRVGQGPSESR